jgi:tRNA G46 methylase TrmB
VPLINWVAVTTASAGQMSTPYLVLAFSSRLGQWVVRCFSRCPGVLCMPVVCSVMSWKPPATRERAASGRVPGALYGSLLLEQPEHRATVDAFHAFIEATGPVALEVGMDNATVLIDHAHIFPRTRWVGLEIRRRKVERAKSAAPTNAYLWAMDARTVFANILPPGRLSQVDIWFPTPTENGNHVLFSEAFVADVARALAPDGVLTIATDVHGLWMFIQELLKDWQPTTPPPRGEARSRRERVCRREGFPVHGGSFSSGKLTSR